MNQQKVLTALIGKGHSSKRAQSIIEEALQSPNPEYILNYWGLRGKVSQLLNK